MLPALFSVSYAGLWGQHALSLPAFLRKAAALGYPAVEIMGKRPHLSVLDADERALSAVREACAETGLRVATVAAYTDFTAGGQAAEVPLVEMQVAHVESLARLARELGAGIVRVFTGYATAPEAAARDWQICVAAIRECAARAEACGVVVAVQNHHETAVSSEAYGEFLADVNHPNCRAAYDPWIPALAGEDLAHYARLLAPRMVQTTLADYVRLPRYRSLRGQTNYEPAPAMCRAVPLGEGIVELEAFFGGLRAGGFDGVVAYEMCSPVRGGGSEANLDRVASASLARIRSLTAAR